MKILSTFLPAIINDDASGLNDVEVEQIQTFVDTYPACVFNASPEAFFDTCDLTGLAGDCVEVSITRPRFKTRYINRRCGATIETLQALDNTKHTDKGFKDACRKACVKHQDKGRVLNDEWHYYVSNRSTKEWRAK